MTSPQAIKPKALHYPEYRLNKRFPSYFSQDLNSLRQARLVKYFPKYYNHLDSEILKEPSWRLINKLSQAKIMIQLVFTQLKLKKSYFSETSKSLGRIEQKIFRNKRKSVKYLPGVSFFLDAKPQILTFFPSITSLDLNEKPQFRAWKNEVCIPMKKILKLYGYFWKALRSLKHLKLSTKNLDFGLLLKHIDSSPYLLASLETFEINFDDDKTFQARAIFEKLAQKRNLLKCITRLNLDGLVGFQDFYEKLISPVLEKCPKLTSLSLPWKASFSREKIIQVSDRLKILSILLHNDLRSFFNDFSISSETLILRFPKKWQGTSWAKLFDNDREKDTKNFEIYKEKLYYLQNLKMELPIIKKSNGSLENLVIPLFEALPSLKTFQCNPQVPEENDEYYGKPFPHDILNFSLFLDCIESKKELESFEISYEENDDLLLSPYSTIKFHPKRGYELPGNLKRVSLSLRFFKDFDFKSFFEIFLGNNGAIKYLKLSMIYFDCPEALNGFLKLVDEILLKTENNLKLDLEMTLYVDNLHKVFCYFKEPIVQNKQTLRKLNIILKPPAGTPVLKVTDEVKDNFTRIFSAFIEFKLMTGYGPLAYRTHIQQV